MNALKRLGDRARALIDHSLFRWVVLLLFAATVIGTAAYSYRKVDRELTTVTLLRRWAIAQLTAITLSEKLGRNSDVAISLSTRVQFRNLVSEGKWDQAIEIMHDIPRDFPQIERLFIADVGGTLRADVPALPGVRGVNFAARDWFRGVSRNWQPYVSPIYKRAVAPQLNVFAVAVPVKSTTGRVVGILVLQIRIESLLQWVAGIDMGTEGFIYIVDSKGQLAFHSKQRDRKEIIDLSATPIMQKLRHGEQGAEIRNDAVDHEEYVVAYSSVPEYGWGVIAQQPTRASLSLQARDALLRQLLVGYGLILLLSAATAVLASRIAGARQREENDRRMKADLEQRVTERTVALQAANQELEAFSYSVSHDLRAPLRAIDGFSQALLEDYLGQLDDQGKNYLNRVRAATQRMGHLIDDMLVLSQITRVEMRREAVDLSALAADVLAELQKSEPERKVDWRIESGLIAEGDAQLLRVALVNLLGNAWKFTGKTANAKIEFGVIPNADGTTDFFVRDNGVGFDMAYASKLFGAFQRLHTLAEFPGTGIGLATVQRIIHRHGGQVHGEGVLGQGATFHFTLPAQGGNGGIS